MEGFCDSIGALDGGPQCHMSLLRKANVTLSNLRNVYVTLSDLRNVHVPCSFKTLCRMSLRPKMPHVALSILGVLGP